MPMTPEPATAAATVHPQCIITSRQLDPPTFAGPRGDDVEDWLDSYNRVGTFNRWDGELKLRNVEFPLIEVPKTWYLNREEVLKTWSQLTTQLRERFGTLATRFAEAERKLDERVQHPEESYTSYIEDVLAFCRRTNDEMAECDRIRPILKGTSPFAFNALAIDNLASVNYIISAFQRLCELPFLRLQPAAYDICDFVGGDLRETIGALIREEIHGQTSTRFSEAQRHAAVPVLRDMNRRSSHPSSPPCVCRRCLDARHNNAPTIAKSSIKQAFQGLLRSGHGSSVGMLPKMPFMFLIQVRKYFWKCFRSNDVCLILLPYPRPLYDSFCYLSVCVRLLLLLGGDIETNLGPTMKEPVQQLVAIAEDIKEIKKGKVLSNEKLNASDQKQEKITGLEKTVTNCVNKVAGLECRLASMAIKLHDLENRSSSSILIAYGVQEQAKESAEMLEKAVVKENFQDVLGVNISAVERIHRLGRPKQGDDHKPRLIIMKLLDLGDKNNIMKNSPKQKGSAFSVGEDFSQAVRYVRKKLWIRTGRGL